MYSLIFFRDLKPENVLVDANGNVVLSDLGLACHIPPSTLVVGFCGTPGYVCLEGMTGERYSAGYQDVWALG